jgi:hypothetical protein
MSEEDIKLSDRSLIALGSILKFDNKITTNFIRNIIKRWPQGRKVLYDLFTNPDLWDQAVFSYKTLGNDQIHKYEVRLILRLRSIQDLKSFVTVESSWPRMDPKKALPPGIRNWSHTSVSKKYFNQEMSKEPAWFNYIRNWYV